MERREIEKLIVSKDRKVTEEMKIVTDTTDFMKLDNGDVLILGNDPYLILRNEKERGFGMDDDPKFWVKRVIDLKNDTKKIVKLVFHEEFIQKMGEFDVQFYRSPIKEARVLDAIEGNPFFMQGTSVNDVKENNVRIIDFINGTPLDAIIESSEESHEFYFHETLPKFLPDLLDCLEALGVLHEKGFVHGDVRWDHVYLDRDINTFRWIDYDYNYQFPENPFGADIFGLGKIIASVFGKGVLLYYDLKNNPQYEKILNTLTMEDFSLLDRNRFVNLKKLYPYIPVELNNVLLNFSGYASNFYLSVNELFSDLRSALKTVFAR